MSTNSGLKAEDLRSVYADAIVKRDREIEKVYHVILERAEDIIRRQVANRSRKFKLGLDLGNTDVNKAALRRLQDTLSDRGFWAFEDSFDYDLEITVPKKALGIQSKWPGRFNLAGKVALAGTLIYLGVTLAT